MLRKFTLLLTIVLCCLMATAQLNIGSSSAPNPYAMFQVTSTNKGLLLPQVALVQTTSSLPLGGNVAGMVIYNTATINDVTPGMYINNGTIWLPLSTATTQNASYTSGTINCTGALSGTYSNGVAMNSSDTKVITITAATAGAYTASTNSLNGVTFAASGTLFSTGANTPVTLVGTGTPTGAGNFTYTASLGGQTCSFVVPFAGGATFTCSGATQSQTPTGALNAGGYSGNYTIPYTAGNGTSYASNTQTISGLILTRAAGTYISGGGNIVYTLSGTYSGAANGSISFTIPECTSVTFGVPSVTSTTGKVWMDRNLGASQVATSSTDALSYGDLYQWGRGTDGHQLRNSATNGSFSGSDVPGNALFIGAPSTPYDWRSPQNGSLWQGLSGTNNPCPGGYRLPTAPEFDAERAIFGTQDAVGGYNSVLKLTMAGTRTYNNGTLNEVGTGGNYWTSSINGIYSGYIYINSTSAGSAYNARSYGWSVRCIMN